VPALERPKPVGTKAGVSVELGRSMQARRGARLVDKRSMAYAQVSRQLEDG